MSYWYAQGSGYASTVSWNDASDGSGNALTWPPASGDSLDSNGWGGIALDLYDVNLTLCGNGFEGVGDGVYAANFTVNCQFTCGSPFTIAGNWTLYALVQSSANIGVTGHVTIETGGNMVALSLSLGPDGWVDCVNGTALGISTGAKIVPASSWIPAASVVSPAYVLVGHDTYTNGAPGEFDEAARNTDPGAANVWNSTGYKICNVAKTGTKVASSIANCTAGNVKKDVVIGDVTGTYEGIADMPDWTEEEKKQIRHRLGIDGTAATPTATPNLITAAERQAIADALLARDVSTAQETAGDHSLCYVILAMSESNTTAHTGKLTVFKADGETEFCRKTITADPTAPPITGLS